jgi:hypothetical protein
MREIGQLLGIPVIDHVVIGQNGYRSILEWAGTDFELAPCDDRAAETPGRRARRRTATTCIPSQLPPGAPRASAS